MTAFVLAAVSGDGPALILWALVLGGFFGLAVTVLSKGGE